MKPKHGGAAGRARQRVEADQRATPRRAGPGAGAGTAAWNTATATTAAATHSVAASAPHFVLPRQNSAATSSGESAAKPENAYWMASEKMLSGACSAMK